MGRPPQDWWSLPCPRNRQRFHELQSFRAPSATLQGNNNKVAPVALQQFRTCALCLSEPSRERRHSTWLLQESRHHSWEEHRTIAPASLQMPTFVSGGTAPVPSERPKQSRTRIWVIKDVRFYPILNIGLFWAALLKMSVFYPTRNFRQFWAPTFSAVKSTFLAKRRPQMLKFYLTQNFGHFWAALLKMPGFTPC